MNGPDRCQSSSAPSCLGLVRTSEAQLWWVEFNRHDVCDLGVAFAGIDREEVVARYLWYEETAEMILLMMELKLAQSINQGVLGCKRNGG